MTRVRWPIAECPKCTSTNLRHHIYSKWHECKECFHRFSTWCSPHKHGGHLA